VTTFALIHGAWHGAWCWEPLRRELERREQSVVAPDLPGEALDAGCSDYADVVAGALEGEDDDVVVVAHSLGGLTGALVPERRPVRELVLLCAMIAVPGRSLNQQFEAGEMEMAEGWGEGMERDEQGRSRWTDPGLFHRRLYPDCSPETAARAFERARPQSQTPSEEPCPLGSWPDVPTRYVLAAEDRCISPEWARRACPERLGVEPIEISSSHSAMVSRPELVASILVSTQGR
jgi:pimeloyl-ACP methyl ester carboxylesterase